MWNINDFKRNHYWRKNPIKLFSGNLFWSILYMAMILVIKFIGANPTMLIEYTNFVLPSYPPSCPCSPWPPRVVKCPRSFFTQKVHLSLISKHIPSQTQNTGKYKHKIQQIQMFWQIECLVLGAVLDWIAVVVSITIRSNCQRRVSHKSHQVQTTLKSQKVQTTFKIPKGANNF